MNDKNIQITKLYYDLRFCTTEIIFVLNKRNNMIHRCSHRRGTPSTNGKNSLRKSYYVPYRTIRQVCL